MREFFYHLLQNLDKLAGLKQFEKLLQMPDAKQEINNLLDILCRVADQFPYIPDEDKKRIIQDATIADGEFIGLNAKIIYKWLNAKRDLYIREAKDEVVIHPEALTGDARQKRLEQVQQLLSKIQPASTTRADMYQTVREQWKPKEGTEFYKPTDPGLVFNHQRHLAYLKANYDAKTGKELPNWISEDEWNILNP